MSSSTSSFFAHRLAYASQASMIISKLWCHENETGSLYFGPLRKRSRSLSFRTILRSPVTMGVFFWVSRVDSSDSSSSKTRKVLTRVGLGSISIPTLHRAGVHHSEPLVLTAIAAKALGKWTRGSERGFTREFTCRYRRSISSIIWKIYHKKELTLAGLYGKPMWTKIGIF